jgi:flagellar FliJ protein
MKRFTFSLQKVLELRKYHEEESKIALGQAISALTFIENNIKETAVRRHHAATERFADTGQLLVWNSYIGRLDQETERLTEEAARAEMTVEEKRTVYLEASRDLKAMEKLKEKREKEYRKEMFAAETAELDILSAGRGNLQSLRSET